LKDQKFKVEVESWFTEAVKEAAEATEKAVNNGLSRRGARDALKKYVNEILQEAIKITKEESTNE